MADTTIEKETEPEIVSIEVTHQSYLSQFLNFEWAYDSYDDDKGIYWFIQSAYIILLFLASTIIIPFLIDRCKNHHQQQQQQNQQQQQQHQEDKSRDKILTTESETPENVTEDTIEDKAEETSIYQQNEETEVEESEQDMLLQKEKNASSSSSSSFHSGNSTTMTKSNSNSTEMKKHNHASYLERKILYLNQSSKILKHIVLGSIYCAFSISLIFLNDYLIDKVFPYSATLTMFHMGSGIILSALCLYGFKVASTDGLSQMTLQNYIIRFFPLGLFYAAEVYCENESYEYLDVAFLQILKPFGTIMTFFFLFLLQLETFTKEKLIILAVIVFSSAIAGIGASDLGEWNTTGFTLALCGDLFYALYLTYSQVLLQNYSLYLNPFVQLLCIGPSAFLGLLFYAYFVEWGDDSFRSSFENLSWWVITIDCLIAFGLNISILLVIQNLSSLSLILISYAKEILVVFLAWIFIPSEAVNDIELEGYILEIIGLTSWKYIALSDDNAITKTEELRNTTSNILKKETVGVKVEDKIEEESGWI